jgi:hypothetical protein
VWQPRAEATPSVAPATANRPMNQRECRLVKRTKGICKCGALLAAQVRTTTCRVLHLLCTKRSLNLPGQAQDKHERIQVIETKLVCVCDTEGRLWSVSDTPKRESLAPERTIWSGTNSLHPTDLATTALAYW